jgi:hypothetical protein
VNKQQQKEYKMSSCLLSNDEFQMIADFLYMNGISKRSSHAFDIKTFIGFENGSKEHFEATDEQIEKKVIDCVKHLYNLNRLALVTRYGDKYDRNDATEFKPKINPYLKEKEVIETLRSLTYQCGEYIISETSTYKELKEFIGKLCENIFMRE